MIAECPPLEKVSNWVRSSPFSAGFAGKQVPGVFLASLQLLWLAGLTTLTSLQMPQIINSCSPVQGPRTFAFSFYQLYFTSSRVSWKCNSSKCPYREKQTNCKLSLLLWFSIGSQALPCLTHSVCQAIYTVSSPLRLVRNCHSSGRAH